MELNELPGHELILSGIADLRDGRRTPEALLAMIGAARLRAAGLDILRRRCGRCCPSMSCTTY